MTKQNATCCLPFLFKFLHLTYNCYRHIHNFVLGSLSMLQSSLYHCYRHHIYNLSFGSSIDVTVKPLSYVPSLSSLHTHYSTTTFQYQRRRARCAHPQQIPLLREGVRGGDMPSLRRIDVIPPRRLPPARHIDDVHPPQLVTFTTGLRSQSPVRLCSISTKK